MALLAVPAWSYAAPPGFWERWGDGQAEVNGYRLVKPRYGSVRLGQAALIFVTETFSRQEQVKSDRSLPDADRLPVLKLNATEQFQTGIYAYHVMTSAFARIEPEQGFSAGALTKLTFSAQEWCGMVFDELRFEPAKVKASQHSYFEREGTRDIQLDRQPADLTVDELPILVRGLLGTPLQPGQSRAVRVLPSLTRLRLQHQPLAWMAGTLARGAGVASITVPAGTFEVETWTLTQADGWWKRLYVEQSGDRRVVRWETSDGEAADLTGSTRLKYWELNKPGGESALKTLGLSPLPINP